MKNNFFQGAIVSLAPVLLYIRAHVMPAQFSLSPIQNAAQGACFGGSLKTIG